MRVMLNSYPYGKIRALTMSYDDGTDNDRRLAKIFDDNGLRGSFHLNSGYLDNDNRLTFAELPETFRNHEISVHTVTHPSLALVSNEQIIREVMDDRRKLESAAGYPVRGMSYPNGSYDDRVLSVLRSCNIACSRTTLSTHAFKLPADFLAWHPTCHHREGILDLLDTFKKNERRSLSCFFVWGHSYEFPRNDNWDLIEEFSKRAGGDDLTWYATNIEICDYVTALRAVQFSVDERMVHNPSGIDVWVTADNEPVKIPAGKTVRL
ncbi:MAG: polysaccharide deacetylase family protein [Eubacteriales bacterium]|jgi:peptidoglycan/xylan/chitin deacetylase (PgdA/CDA1 family)